MLRQSVLAIFADEASADAAAEGLNRWAGQEAAAKLIDSDDGAVAEVDTASIAVPADASVITTA